MGKIVSQRAADQFGPDPLIAHQLLGTGAGEAVADDLEGDVAHCGVEADHGWVGDFDAFRVDGVGEGEVVVGESD